MYANDYNSPIYSNPSGDAIRVHSNPSRYPLGYFTLPHLPHKHWLWAGLRNHETVIFPMITYCCQYNLKLLLLRGWESWNQKTHREHGLEQASK